MVMQSGSLEVVDYKWLGCDHPEYQNVVDLDCIAGSDHIKLNKLHETKATTDGPVLTADKLQTIHQLFNCGEDKEEAVSIHVYSRPIDSCVAFDLDGQRCYRRQLDYFSEYGEVAAKRQPQVPAWSRFRDRYFQSRKPPARQAKPGYAGFPAGSTRQPKIKRTLVDRSPSFLRVRPVEPAGKPAYPGLACLAGDLTSKT
jgi:hypothetical protein